MKTKTHCVWLSPSYQKTTLNYDKWTCGLEVLLFHILLVKADGQKWPYWFRLTGFLDSTYWVTQWCSVFKSSVCKIKLHLVVRRNIASKWTAMYRVSHRQNAVFYWSVELLWQLVAQSRIAPQKAPQNTQMLPLLSFKRSQAYFLKVLPATAHNEHYCLAGRESFFKLVLPSLSEWQGRQNHGCTAYCSSWFSTALN